jgi:general secretion pathway protein A
LLGAYTRGRQVVDASIVKRAAREIGQGAGPMPRIALRALAATVALGLALGAAVWQWWPETSRVSASGKDAGGQAVSTEPVQAESESVATSTPGTQAAPAAPVADAQAATGPADAVTKLESSLAAPEARTDTESAMKDLFGHWGLDYTVLAGATACERALNAGLRCVYQTGTWNNLRERNRPAVIELQDASGRKHHVLVTSLTADSVSLTMGGTPREFGVQEVGRLWFGKYLLLWKPEVPAQEILRLGDRGEAVLWLRDALARYRNEPLVAETNDLFDVPLRTQVMQFQSRHRLAADGVVGGETLAKLQGYFPAKSPVLIAANVAAEAR